MGRGLAFIRSAKRRGHEPIFGYRLAAGAPGLYTNNGAFPILHGIRREPVKFWFPLKLAGSTTRQSCEKSVGTRKTRWIVETVSA